MQLPKVLEPKKTDSEEHIRGVVTSVGGNVAYVKFDGAQNSTPCEMMEICKVGNRVLVLVLKSGKCIVLGNTNVDDTVVSVVSEYAQASSGLVAPESGWSTKQAPWEDGKYIWTRTKTVSKSGSVAYTLPACITGAVGAKGEKGDKGDQGEQGEQGKQGAKGDTGNGIKSEEEFFLVSAQSTGITTSVTGWSNTPSVTSPENRYLWTYTKTTYTNGTTVNSKPRVIGVHGEQGERGLQGIQGEQGKQGIPGAKGEDGKTTYFHIKYAPVINPTSDQMTETPSAFIGTYVDYTEADSTNPAKYTWSQFTGSQGAQGIPGANGSNGKTSYLHLAYANSANGSSGFSVSDSTGKKYIGQYTDFTQADSTDYTKYKWSLIKGDTGEKGADGNGIKSTVVTYQLGTSATSAPTGTWTTTIPKADTSKPYLWTRIVTTYTNNTTSTSYLVGSSIDGFEVGGRNLFRGSLSIEGEWGWVNNGATPELVQLNNETVVHASQDTAKQSIPSFALSKSILLEWGETYVYSGEIMFDSKFDLYSVSTPLHYHVGSVETIGTTAILNKGGGVGISRISPTAATNTPANTWQKFVYLIKTEQTAPNSSYPYPVIRPIIYGNISSTATVKNVWVRNVKIEKGNKATDWTPAPEDVSNDIGGVRSQVVNADAAIDKALERIKQAEDAIVSINGNISTLVTDGLSTAMMVHDETGWHFSTQSIQEAIDSIRGDLKILSAAKGSTETTVEALRKSIEAFDSKLSYVNIGEYEREPCIELGQTNNDYKVIITNTKIMFQVGTNVPTYITENGLVTTNINVGNTFSIGDFVWRVRPNGHLGLQHV